MPRTEALKPEHAANRRSLLPVSFSNLCHWPALKKNDMRALHLTFHLSKWSKFLRIFSEPFKAMATVNLEYKYDTNSWRTSCDANFIKNDSGWPHIDVVEKELADSFIAERNRERITDPLLRFKNVEKIRMLLKIHAGVYAAKKKNQEYTANGINKKVFYN